MTPRRHEHIVMATDLGPASATATRFAGALASAIGAKLTIFHAIAPLVFSDFGGWDPQSFAVATEGQKLKARDEILRFCSAELDESIQLSVEVRECSPVQGIVQFASTAGADLLILGTHAWGPVASVFLGSVTQGVLHQSDVPVITIRPGKAGAVRLRRILCPVDSFESANRAVSQASLMAEATGAELRLLPIDWPATNGGQIPRVDWQPGSASLDLGRPLDRRRHPAEEIFRYARDHEIDLVVMAIQHGRFRDTTLVGTTTARMIRTAPCAVMAVPTVAKDEEHLNIGAA